MNESSLWQYIREGMKVFWHATRIESSAGNGVPDVSFGIDSSQRRQGVNGWIELKYIKEWPKRLSTKVKLPLRPEQRLWIRQRGRVAGDVWVLCRIEDNFFLLSWSRAEKACEGFDWYEWKKYSHSNWLDKINFNELKEALINGC
jgi:hypothetical protein